MIILKILCALGSMEILMKMILMRKIFQAKTQDQMEIGTQILFQKKMRMIMSILQRLSSISLSLVQSDKLGGQ